MGKVSKRSVLLTQVTTDHDACPNQTARVEESMRIDKEPSSVQIQRGLSQTKPSRLTESLANGIANFLQSDLRNAAVALFALHLELRAWSKQALLLVGKHGDGRDIGGGLGFHS